MSTWRTSHAYSVTSARLGFALPGLLALLMLACVLCSAQARAQAFCGLAANAPTAQSGAPGSTLNYTFDITEDGGCGTNDGTFGTIVITSDTTGGASVSPGSYSDLPTTESFSITLGPNPGSVGVEVRCGRNCDTPDFLDFTATATGSGSPAISVSKALTNNADGDGSGSVTLGDVLTFTVNATNTGSVALTNVQVNDPLTTPSSTLCASVAIGATCVLSGTYTVTTADATTGSITNTGSATSAEIGTPVTSTLNTPTGNSLFTIAIQSGNGQSGMANAALPQPLIALVENDGGNASGVTVNWAVTSGTATVSAPTSVSNGSGLAQINVTFGSTPGPVTITATRADDLSKFVTFNATITAGGGPAISVSKVLTNNADGDGSGTVTLGDVLTFRVTATNSGSVAMTNVQVNDPITTPNTITCPSVAIDATCVLSGTYTVTAADVSNGSITNNGTASSAQTGTPVSTTLTTPVVSTVTVRSIVIAGGDNQSGAPDSALPTPLSVDVRNNGTPVAGVTVQWAVTAGTATLGSPTSLTDSSGLATNTVTLGGTPGTVTISATRADDLSKSVTFQESIGLSGGISSIPGLTPLQLQVANALDNACAALAASSSLSPAEQDLFQQCQALSLSAAQNPGEARSALDQLFASVAFLQTSAAMLISNEQFTNIKTRIAALRSGTGGTHFGGLAFNTPSGTLPVGSIGDTLLGLAGDKKEETGAGFDRWGFFAAGTFGRGSADPRQVTPGYDFHTNGITAGVDYRYSDKLIFGVSAGYAKYNSDVNTGHGGLDTRGWSLSAYSTFFRQDSWYVDGVLTYGNNSYDITRRIVYTLTNSAGTTTVDQSASSNSNGSTLAGALTFGRDFSKGPWSFGPYFRGTYTRINFGDSREVLLSNAIGNGLGLAIQSRDLKSTATVLGGKVNYAFSHSWGVLMPHAEVEWEHEFQDSPDSVSARFLHDPTATPIQVGGDSIDTDFFRLGLGLSFVFTGGRSGFLYYEKTLGRQGITQDNLALGIRLEF